MDRRTYVAEQAAGCRASVDNTLGALRGALAEDGELSPEMVTGALCAALLAAAGALGLVELLAREGAR